MRSRSISRSQRQSSVEALKKPTVQFQATVTVPSTIATTHAAAPAAALTIDNSAAGPSQPPPPAPAQAPSAAPGVQSVPVQKAVSFLSPAAASEYWSPSGGDGGSGNGPLVEAADADVDEWSAARTEALREWGHLESSMRNALKTAASYAVELGTLPQEFEETLDFGGARLLSLFFLSLSFSLSLFLFLFLSLSLLLSFPLFVAHLLCSLLCLP